MRRAFAAGLFEARRLYEPGAPKMPINDRRAGPTLELGPFEHRIYPVAHSIPESQRARDSHAARARSLHTGDWKIDPEPGVGGRPTKRGCARSATKAFYALICDSTNILREGDSPSEADVARDAARAHRRRRKGASW